jgi:chromosome segregation ATPase
MKMLLLIIQALVVWVVLSGPGVAGEVYTWTDKDGNIHITDRPPTDEARLDGVIRYSDKAVTNRPTKSPSPRQDTADEIQAKQLNKHVTRLDERKSQLEKIIAENQESITDAEKELKRYRKRSGTYARRTRKTIQRQLMVLKNNLTMYQSDLHYVEEDMLETKQLIKTVKQKMQQTDDETGALETAN